MAQLTPKQRALVEAPNFAHFVTLMKDGSPQVTPVWIDCDETHILVNTAEGRQKPLNLARDNRVALSILDQENPYIYIQIRGKVVEVTREGAWEHINKMARKEMEGRLITRLKARFQWFLVPGLAMIVAGLLISRRKSSKLI